LLLSVVNFSILDSGPQIIDTDGPVLLWCVGSGELMLDTFLLKILFDL
jgi:hypothetical protein